MNVKAENVPCTKKEYILVVRLPSRWRKNAMRQLLYYMTQKIVLFVADFFLVEEKKAGGKRQDDK